MALKLRITRADSMEEVLPRGMVRIWKAGENYKSVRFVEYSTLNVASNKQ